MGGESSDEEGRRWSTPSLRVVRRSVSWNDEAGRELEAVLSIERRPKRPSFFSQSLSIIKVRPQRTLVQLRHSRAPVGPSPRFPLPGDERRARLVAARARAPHAPAF